VTPDQFLLLAIISAYSIMLIGIVAQSMKPQNAVLWIKNTGEMELRRAIFDKSGDIVVEIKGERWSYKPPADLKPIELRVGSRLYKVFIVDKNLHAFYEIPELDESEVETEFEVKGKKFKLNRVMLDPRVLYNYIGSKSMEKLIKPLRVGKAEAVGYVAIGGFLAFILVFFILPLLGKPVTVGG